MTSTWSKHAKITRPQMGNYHRHEIALMGAPCDIIKAWATEMATLWAPLKVGFLDMDHHPSPLSHPFHQVVSHQQTYFEEETAGFPSDFGLKIKFQPCDRLIINGNHFEGAEQIVFIDPKKNVAKHAKKINAPLMVIVREGASMPTEIQEVISENTPVFQETQKEEITTFLKAWSLTKQPKVNGLLLVGGKSQRMGEDKSQLVYQQEPQWKIAVDLLAPYCQEVFISCNEQQSAQFEEHPLIVDKYLGLGPIGGILSAFQHDPDAAWLVIAVDLPLLSSQTLHQLIDQRDSSTLATCFQVPDKKFPEPLITIWEPRAYPIMLQYLSLGYSCPRKVLINEPCKVISPLTAEALENINTPEEKEAVIKKMQP